MQKQKVHLLIASAIGGLFLIVDQVLKYIAEQHQNATYYYIKPWLGWEYLKNPGVAFGIPIPSYVVIPLSFIILLMVFRYLSKSEKKTLLSMYALALITSGAISNLIDRVLYSATIDYIRIIHSIINIADILIILGVLLLLSDRREKNKRLSK